MNVYAILPGLLGREKSFFTWDSMRALNDDGRRKLKIRHKIKEETNLVKRMEKVSSFLGGVNIYFIVCSLIHW